MAAACFGVVYAFFVASLVSLGITLSPAIRLVLKLAQWIGRKFDKHIPEPKHDLAPFEWTAVLFALFSAIIIFGFGRENSTVYWSLPLLSVGLYFFYSIYVSSGNKIKKIEAVKNSVVITPETENANQLGDSEELRRMQLFTLATILIVPLLVGGVSGQLLDAAMRVAHVRIEKANIYIKEPYSSLLPDSLALKGRRTPKEYAAYEDVLVLFKGFGKSTVITFSDGDVSRKLEIPNDHIIIENR